MAAPFEHFKPSPVISSITVEVENSTPPCFQLLIGKHQIKHPFDLQDGKLKFKHVWLLTFTSWEEVLLLLLLNPPSPSLISHINTMTKVNTITRVNTTSMC